MNSCRARSSSSSRLGYRASTGFLRELVSQPISLSHVTLPSSPYPNHQVRDLFDDPIVYDGPEPYRHLHSLDPWMSGAIYQDRAETLAEISNVLQKHEHVGRIVFDGVVFDDVEMFEDTFAKWTDEHQDNSRSGDAIYAIGEDKVVEEIQSPPKSDIVSAYLAADDEESDVDSPEPQLSNCEWTKEAIEAVAKVLRATLNKHAGINPQDTLITPPQPPSSTPPLAPFLTSYLPPSPPLPVFVSPSHSPDFVPSSPSTLPSPSVAFLFPPLPDSSSEPGPSTRLYSPLSFSSSSRGSSPSTPIPQTPPSIYPPSPIIDGSSYKLIPSPRSRCSPFIVSPLEMAKVKKLAALPESMEALPPLSQTSQRLVRSLSAQMLAFGVPPKYNQETLQSSAKVPHIATALPHSSTIRTYFPKEVARPPAPVPSKKRKASDCDLQPFVREEAPPVKRSRPTSGGLYCLHPSCRTPDKVYANMKERNRHMDTHYPHRFACPACDTKFSRPESVARHLNEQIDSRCKAMVGTSRDFAVEEPYWQQTSYAKVLKVPSEDDPLYMRILRARQTAAFSIP